MKINLPYNLSFMAAVKWFFSDWQTYQNEFKVHSFIMQNAGYKHFGFLLTIFLAPYYIASRTFAKITNIQTFMCT